MIIIENTKTNTVEEGFWNKWYIAIKNPLFSQPFLWVRVKKQKVDQVRSSVIVSGSQQTPTSERNENVGGLFDREELTCAIITVPQHLMKVC